MVNRKSAGYEQPSENKRNDGGLRERLHLDRAGTLAMSIGAAAVAGALVAGGVTVSHHIDKESQVVVSTADREATLLALQKVLVGGNTDNTSWGIENYLNALGMLRAGDQVHRVEYSADVARQEASSEEGAFRAVQEVNAALSRGEPVMLIGFSLGGDVVARAGQQLAAANGGVLPPGVKVVSYGGPASSTGFWASLPGEVGGPWASLFGVDMSARLPAGSDEHSDQNDIWGNGANQYLAGTLLQAIATGTGSHRIPSENEPRIDWVDDSGVHHFRYSVGENPMVAIAKSQHLYMAPGSEGYWNAAANAAFPINNGRDGLPNPDGQALIDNLAHAFDVQAGTGNLFYILSRFIPGAFVQLGLDLVNKLPNALAEGVANIQNGVINGVNNAGNTLHQLATEGPAAIPQSVLAPQSVQSFTLDTPAPFAADVASAPAPEAAPETPQDVTPPATETVVTTPEVSVESAPSVAEAVNPAPAEETPEVPVVETPAPEETPAPAPVEEAPAPAPVEEAPAPVVETPAPVVEEAPVPVPAPVVEEAPAPAPAPVVVEAPAPAPVVEAPAPAPEPAPAPVEEAPAPVVEEAPAA